MPTFAVTYRYAQDSAEQRDAHRPEHKDFLADLHERGVLRASGPVDGGDGALLVLQAESRAAVTGVLDGDPFHREGLIGERTIREWSLVFGGLR
ncbi:hypothetical protein IQ251_04355 [Saccharopolyspora sp. HNM0983]|uniref:YCII-related domain-containing protein n=1 Tax=Saccharopolyspora montiporae TaxID=2781240 RepID=A0A929B8U2_9PSEU|nr:YciI family protein [Saccharopolyspora sp. HNM0983]MBE9373678.1 hypothetical protein [Saccharopolyspora sp. HNM0983]